MQRKLAENQSRKEGGSVSAPDLTCDLGDVDRSENEDSEMSSDSECDADQTPRSASANL